jgi:hypothetical protein
MSYATKEQYEGHECKNGADHGCTTCEQWHEQGGQEKCKLCCTTIYEDLQKPKYDKEGNAICGMCKPPQF